MREAIALPEEITTLAYAAGLFDGEGSVAITYSKRTGSEQRYHRLQISVTNTDPRVLVWLRDRFGGCITNVRLGANTRQRPSARWQTSLRRAEAFLRAVRPYLVIKGEQADVAVALRATIRPHAGNVFGRHGVAKDGVTDDLRARRESLRQALHVLNRRGVSAVS